ncbi:MAG: hypothetical protein ACYC1L_02810 [Alphaproteobacteria bacterium]
MTDDSRGPDGLWRKGHSGNPATMFKPGDPANPRTRQKRARAARGTEPSAAEALRREEMRAELVALGVLERLLSGSKATTPLRLPRLPEDSRNRRREARRLAARSKTRALKAMQRIARDPNEAPDVRLAIARLLLESVDSGLAGPAARAHGPDAETSPKVIVVNRNAPRSPWKTGLAADGTPEPI